MGMCLLNDGSEVTFNQSGIRAWDDPLKEEQEKKKEIGQDKGNDFITILNM